MFLMVSGFASSMKYTKYSLNKKNNDFDLCTTFQPDKVLSMLKIQNIKCLETGKNFGTITAMINGIKFEITTLRKDVECDGRHTDVKFVNSYEVDSKRRDLTINALYMNKNKEVFDYNNSLKDLENGLICGDETSYIDKNGKTKYWRGPTLNKRPTYFRVIIRRRKFEN